MCLRVGCVDIARSCIVTGTAGTQCTVPAGWLSSCQTLCMGLSYQAAIGNVPFSEKSINNIIVLDRSL